MLLFMIIFCIHLLHLYKINNNYSFLGDVHMIQLIAQVTIQNMSKRDNIKIKLSVLEENEEEEVVLHTSLRHQISPGVK